MNGMPSPDFFEQKGIDIAKTPVEVMVSEFMQKGPSEFCGSGIKVDKECASSVPGLYAARIVRPGPSRSFFRRSWPMSEIRSCTLPEDAPEGL